MSSVSVISYKIQEFVPSDNPKLNGKKQVLFGFTSYGWITEQGIDFSRVTWILIDKEEWMNMMTAYAKVSSSQKNESVITFFNFFECNQNVINIIIIYFFCHLIIIM